MSEHTWGKRWDHHLRIKHIFMGDDTPSLPEASDTIAMAAKVADVVRSFMGRLDEDSQLRADLDDCLDEFELSGIDNGYEARDRFNGALHVLYDVADYGKRVWIE